MIAQQHEVARTIGWIEAARRVGDDEGVRAQFVHDPHGQRQSLQCIPFVKVETALHHHHRHIFYCAEQ